MHSMKKDTKMKSSPLLSPPPLFLIFSFNFFLALKAQNQGTSDIPCDPRQVSSASNCDYGQYDSLYTSRSQAQKDAAWDMIPGQTCGVMDPTLRPGTSMSRSNMQVYQASLMQKIQEQLT